jgi:hypothetical protein
MSKANDLTKTYSGVFGNRVVVNEGKRKSKITMPLTKPRGKPSVKQVDQRARMKRSAVYAANAMKDPDLRAMYAAKSRKGLPPFRVAANDYLRPPYIHKINASGYYGFPGDKISVTAGDDFGLAGVSVKISDTGNNIIEEGSCVLNMPTGNYDYFVTILVSALPGLVVTAKATDVPGNETELSVTL